MSKFDYGQFQGGEEIFAVNAEKYSEGEAVTIFEDYFEGLGYKVGFENGMYGVHLAYVKWRCGINDDGEHCCGWWLEYTKRPKGSCKVYTFIKII